MVKHNLHDERPLSPRKLRRLRFKLRRGYRPTREEARRLAQNLFVSQDGWADELQYRGDLEVKHASLTSDHAQCAHDRDEILKKLQDLANDHGEVFKENVTLTQESVALAKAIREIVKERDILRNDLRDARGKLEAIEAKKKSPPDAG